MTDNIRIASVCMESSPIGILHLDSTGKIVWLNKALESMTGVDADRLVGHDSESLPFSYLSGLLGDDRTIHLYDPEQGSEKWLECHMQKAGDAAETEIRFFLDITEQTLLRGENERLRQQIEELSITDDLTGLANRRALTRALNAQVTRSRRYQNPLSLAVIGVSNASSPEAVLPDEVILSFSRYLRDRLRWVDLIARWDQDQFFVLLPETEKGDGCALLEKVRDNLSEVLLPQEYAGTPLRFTYGLAGWEKGMDPHRLMEQAVEAMHDAKDRVEVAP